MGHQSSAVTCEALRRAIVEREAMSHNSNGLSLSISTKYCRKGDTRRPRMNVASAALLCAHSPNEWRANHPPTHQSGSLVCARFRRTLRISRKRPVWRSSRKTLFMNSPLPTLKNFEKKCTGVSLGLTV